MPIYEYNCTNCNHQFDLLEKISDAPAKECPHCHKDTAVRLVSAAAFQLKGSGWYATDFKNKPGEGSKSGSGSSSTSTASDKKTADTPAAASKPATSSKGESD